MVAGLFGSQREALRPVLEYVDTQIPTSLGRLNQGLNATAGLQQLASQQALTSLPKLNLFNPVNMNDPQRLGYAQNFANVNRQALEQPFRDNVQFINNMLTNAGLGASSLNIDAQNRQLENFINKYGELVSQGQLAYDDVQQNKFKNDLLGLQSLGGLTEQAAGSQQNLVSVLLNSLANQERNAAAADQTGASIIGTVLSSLFS